jgi:hypothetical protein
MTFTTIAIITLAIVLAVSVWRLHRAERRIELLRERLQEVEELVAPGAGPGVGPAGAGGPGGVRW